MPGPLEGLRILDLTTMVSGPLASMILGDYGAEVVKVEPPGSDPLRVYGSTKNGTSAWYANTNRSKRAITLDLERPEAVAALRRIAAGYDVVMQNFRPGVMDRLGVGYDDLRPGHDDLIYVSISGFGDTGPYAGRRVYDPIIQTMSGLAASQANSAGEPQLVRQMISDKLTAVAAAQAITSAHVAVLRGRGGQHVKLAMIDAVLAFLWGDVMMHCSLLDDDARHTPNVLTAYRLAKAKDGWLTVGTATDAQFRGMWAALGRPEVADREENRTVASRAARWGEVVAEYEAELARHSLADLMPLLEAADVASSPVLTAEQVVADPQVRHLGTVREVDHPVVGRLRETRPPAQFTGTPAEASRPAPAAGQHTDEVLREAGFSPDEIAGLRTSGAAA